MRRLVVSVLSIAVVAALGSGCSSGAPPAPGPALSTPFTSSPEPSAASTTTTSSDDRAAWTCPDPIDVALPIWARAGWSPPTQPVPHLVGASQLMIAVPFGWPLRDPAHQPADHANKILWVAKTGGGPLRIVATEQTNGESVTKEILNGPGPSIVDMPRAGCWRFALSWGNQRDEMFIRYYGESAPKPGSPGST